MLRKIFWGRIVPRMECCNLIPSVSCLEKRLEIMVPWQTKYTTLCFTYWQPKLRSQFSEDLELWIYEFLFNSGDRICKEKKYGSSENWKFKIWQKFSTNSLFFGLILFFLFVLSKRVRQKSGSSHSNVFLKERVHREK